MNIWFYNNLLEENSANFASCFDVESDGTLDFQFNKFLNNYIAPTVLNQVGAGTILTINGQNLVVYSKNNIYFQNIGFLYGINILKIILIYKYCFETERKCYNI